MNELPQVNERQHMPRFPSVPVSRASAFTLVELMVVVGVITLLISMLMPALNAARRQAKTVVCASNYNQIGLALIMYANENRGRLFQLNNDAWRGGVNDRYMLYNNLTNSTGGGGDVRLLLNPYVGKSFGGWICPFVDAARIDDPANTSTLAYCTTWLFFSYQSYSHYEPVYQYTYKGNGFPMKFSDAPPSLPLAQDAYTRLHTTTSAGWNICHNSAGGTMVSTTSNNLSDAHNEVQDETLGLGTTILFYDGSARFVPRGELVRVDWLNTTPNHTYATKSLLP